MACTLRSLLQDLLNLEPQCTQTLPRRVVLYLAERTTITNICIDTITDAKMCSAKIHLTEKSGHKRFTPPHAICSLGVKQISFVFRKVATYDQDLTESLAAEIIITHKKIKCKLKYKLVQEVSPCGCGIM